MMYEAKYLEVLHVILEDVPLEDSSDINEITTMDSDEGYANLLLAGFALAPLVPSIDPKILVIGTACLLVYVASYHCLYFKYDSATVIKQPLLPIEPAWVSLLVEGTAATILLLPLMFPSAIDVALSVYFTLVGTGAFMHTSFRAVSRYLPRNWNEDIVVCRLPYFPSIKVEFTRSQIVVGVLGTVFSVWYACQKHWLPNNIFVLALSIEAIHVLPRCSFKTHAIILLVFFLHDCLRINSENRDFPITLLFPTTDSTRPFFKFEMIDIVIPGRFVVLLMRFDIAKGRVTSYYYSAFVGYFAGLIFTMIAMTWYEVAKYELLFLLPCVMGFVIVHSIWKGQISELWEYKEFENDESSQKDDVVVV